MIQLIGSVLHDERIALCDLWKSPRFNTIIVIGAITATLSVLDAVVLKPLPYPDGDR